MWVIMHPFIVIIERFYYSNVTESEKNNCLQYSMGLNTLIEVN